MFAKARGTSTGARAIKGWVRDALALDDGATILVSELRCHEPGCPPVETVIAIMRGPGDTSQFKIHRPTAEVTQNDVARIVESPIHAENP